MSVVYWDTMLFVYWFEENEAFADRLHTIFEGMERRGDKLITSAVAVAELLVGPQRQKRVELSDQIEEAIKSLATILPFSLETAKHYSAIRANQKVSPADAIHLASAAEANADLFLTNDNQLRGKVIPGIQFIAGLDINLY
jgi:uncharacterized protein